METAVDLEMEKETVLTTKKAVMTTRETITNLLFTMTTPRLGMVVKSLSPSKAIKYIPQLPIQGVSLNQRQPNRRSLFSTRTTPAVLTFSRQSSFWLSSLSWFPATRVFILYSGFLLLKKLQRKK